MKNASTLVVISIILAITMILAGCATSSSDHMNLTPGGNKVGSGSSVGEKGPDQPDEEPSNIPIFETPDRLEVHLTQTPPSGLERVETHSI